MVKTIKNKFNDINKKMEELINGAIENPMLLSEYDIIKTLDLTQDELEYLNGYATMDLSPDELEDMRELSDAYAKKIKMIDIANEKIILSNPKLTNKNTMTYLLSKASEDKQKNNVVIKINVDDNFEKIDLKKLGVIEENDK